jgi:hypothetical protein
MRWRLIALTSLGVNVVFAGMWLISLRHPFASGKEASDDTLNSAGAVAKTNLVVRRQLFSWQEVESGDYPTYIANLRNIGCPEQTIRDIIIADVNALYARRRAMDPDIVTPQQQWWRSEPDTNVLRVALEKVRGLEEERRNLLSRLLGISWESGDLANLPRPSHPGVLLDGPILGPLPTEAKQAVQDINARSEERLQAYLEEERREGETPNPAELARIRQETRNELARVLSPLQLEEFLLRYSQTASDLRSGFGELRYFNPSAEEFRAIFRATDSIDQQLQALAASADPNSVQARQNLESQRENAIRTALGQRRYEEYQLLHDPLYRAAVASAQEAGTPEAARTIYQVNLAAQETQNAIITNTNLTAEQRAIELKQLEADQLRANAVAAGQPLLPDLPPLPPTQPRRTYTLRPGDSPATIGLIYGIPEGAIRAANPNVDFRRLRPGDAINLPRTTLTPRTAPLVAPGGP